MSQYLFFGIYFSKLGFITYIPEFTSKLKMGFSVIIFF